MEFSLTMVNKNKLSTLNVYFAISLVVAITQLSTQANGNVQQETGSNSGNSSESSSDSEKKEPIKCFACGLEEVNPELDGLIYGDFRRQGVKDAEAKDGKTRMMYNHTCDIAEEMGIDDRWLRTCPPGKKLLLGRS